MSSLADFYYLLALHFFNKDITKLNLVERIEVISKTQKKLTEELKRIILNLSGENNLEAKKIIMCLNATKKIRDHSVFERFPEIENYVKIAYQEFLAEESLEEDLD
jgi:hypothetical protein